MVDIKKVISYLIPLIFLVLMVIWLFGGSFPELKEKVSGIKEYVKFGAEEELGAKPTIADDHRVRIQNLLKTMNEMKKSSVKNCFANYGGLPPLGEKGTSITFSYDAAKDATKVIVKGGAEGVQIVEIEEGKGELELPGIRPCVIAGKNGDEVIAKNFYDTFLNEKPEVKKYFTFSINDFTLAYDRGNHISTGGRTIDSGFQDGGWLFTPGDGKICFFPSTTGLSCGGKIGGLQNDCLEDDPSETDSIPYLYGRGKLLECSQNKGYGFIEATIHGSSGKGIISGRCPVGGRCTFRESCKNTYQSNTVNRPNCVIGVTMDNDDSSCGWIEVKPGTKIGHGNVQNKLNQINWYTTQDASESGDLSVEIVNQNLHIFLFNTADPELTCGNNGVWNIFGLVDVAYIPAAVDDRFKTEAGFSQFGINSCADLKDNDDNSRIDCDDSSCLTNLACIQDKNGGQILKKSCFDSLDNEMILVDIDFEEDGSYQGGIKEDGSANKLIDCADPICEDVEYQKQKCSESEVINLI